MWRALIFPEREVDNYTASLIGVTKYSHSRSHITRLLHDAYIEPMNDGPVLLIAPRLDSPLLVHVQLFRPFTAVPSGIDPAFP